MIGPLQSSGQVDAKAVLGSGSGAAATPVEDASRLFVRKQICLDWRTHEFAQLREWLKASPGASSSLQVNTGVRKFSRQAKSRSASGALDKINALEAQFHEGWNKKATDANALADRDNQPLLNEGADSILSPPSVLNEAQILHFVPELVGDARWQSAAMSFAKGEDDACRLALLKLAPDVGLERVESALLGFYLATGDREAFERLSLTIATRTQKSVAEWPVWAEVRIKDAAAARPDSPASTTTTWVSPDHLKSSDLPPASDLAQTWDWRSLKNIDAQACEDLLALWSPWLNKSSAVTFMGEEALKSALEQQLTDEGSTPVSDADAERAQAPYKLFLLVWQLLGDEVAFEDLAMRYCLRFEESPPAWVPAKTQVMRGPVDGIVQPTRVSPLSTGKVRVDANRWALAGQPTAAMISRALSGADAERAPAWVDVKRLLRLDVEAAKTLLDCVGARRKPGSSRPVLSGAHPLIVALLDGLGGAEQLTLSD